MTNSVVIYDTCSECTCPREVTSGQVARNGELLWFRSYSCESCGFRVEEDGFGIEPEIRSLLLAKDGEFWLRVDATGDRTRALAMIRQLLKIELQEIAALRAIDPRCVACGTRIEMEWLRQSLSTVGIASQYLPLRQGEKRGQA